MGSASISRTPSGTCIVIPETTYSQLMVTTHKAESEMKEAKDKVRARSAVTTEVVDSSKELGNQVAKLMAALNKSQTGPPPCECSK